MPFAVGGGIRSIEDIRNVIKAGAEKVVIGSMAAKNPDFLYQAADTFGSSTIVVCIDFKKRFLGKVQTWYLNGEKTTGISPAEFAQIMGEKGVGELIIQSIERDGVMQGYDLELIKKISESVKIPIVALGGAGSLNDLADAYKKSFANGLAAGSLFVYHGARHGVLINYPDRQEITKLFS